MKASIKKSLVVDGKEADGAFGGHITIFVINNGSWDIFRPFFSFNRLLLNGTLRLWLVVITVKAIVQLNVFIERALHGCKLCKG